MKNKLVLCDLDGTLYDTSDVNYASYKQALNENGYQIDYNFFTNYCNGRNYKDFIPKIVPSCDQDFLQNIHIRKKEIYKSNLNLAKRNTFLFDILKALKKDCYVAVITTASRRNCQEILEYFGDTEVFDTIVSQEDVKKLKPDPEAYLFGMKYFNISPENTLIFEDSKIGIDAAFKSGANVMRIEKF